MDKNKSSYKLKGLPPIYYLNLDEQPERAEYMEGQFKYWEIEDYTRISAYDGRDGRDLGDILKKVSYRPAVLPLAGVHRPHMTVKESIRHSINSILTPPYSNLYGVLEFLVFRQWLDQSKVTDFPKMDCYACGKEMKLPRGRQIFECPNPSCKHEHFLSDYLQIAQTGSDDWSKEDAATAMMSVMEHLSILEIPVKCVKESRCDALKQFLFIKDGPLLLRAALSRLVEPIRDFIQWLKEQGVGFYLVGVEKSGDFANFINEQKDIFADSEGNLLTGSYFIPSVKFLLEEVSGQTYNPATYRNRVHYGAKVGVALSERHLVVLNVPTGNFLTDPTCADLIGFDNIVCVLKGLVSASYSNAIIPLVLANQAVSLSYEPSGSILTQFVDDILDKSKGAA